MKRKSARNERGWNESVSSLNSSNRSNEDGKNENNYSEID